MTDSKYAEGKNKWSIYQSSNLNLGITVNVCTFYYTTLACFTEPFLGYMQK